MWSAPVGDGANRRRTLISLVSLGRYSGYAVTITTRHDRREQRKRPTSKRRRGGSGRGMNQLVVVGVAVVAFVALVLGLRAAGVFEPPPPPPPSLQPGE